MSRTIALSLLAQGNTGEQILQILDSIVSDIVVDADSTNMPILGQSVPSLNEMAF